MARWLLLPFSWLYCIVIRLLNACYDNGIFKTTKVNVPVISVGNMTAGGTGKTPFVEYLIRYCETQQKKVAVLSRGYKRHSQGTVVIEAGNTVRGDAMLLGDEPFQLARKFPHLTMIVDAQRTRSAQIAVNKHHVDVILLDDGFQHRALGRNLDIVMVDGQTPLNRIPLLPAGKRREPLSSLGRANVVAFSRGQYSLNADEGKLFSGQTMKVEFLPKRLCQVHGANVLELHQAKGKSCVAFCGIGTPAAFRQTLESVGLTVLEFFEFPDHHEYSTSELEKIRTASERHKAELVVTTEKDSVRLQLSDAGMFPAQTLFYLEIQADITENKSQFHHLLDEMLEKKS